MRFLEDGPDIPNELIEAQLRGELVFLCGAGISAYNAKLPLFRELTRQVYKDLGELPENEPAEKKAIKRYEFDRALRSLEKRIGDKVRQSVANRLMYSPKMTLDQHIDLLSLSVDSQKRPRILTTNFDTLFERAANKTNVACETHAVRSIPRSGGERDHGILHLHGRIEDSNLNLPRTDLILTSADFGDAYLRDGWASRYLEDRIRQSPMLLVGYGAEDAALRLLLETLDADRERFPDLKNIYAFCSPKKEDISIWRAKGIIPIVSTGHDKTYETLHEWSLQSKDSTEYCNSRIEKILQKKPSEATEFEKEQLTFMLGQTNVSAIVELNASLSWGKFLWEQKGEKIKKKDFLAEWVKKNLQTPATITDVASNIDYFDKETIDWIRLQLDKERSNLSSIVVDGWNVIAQYVNEKKEHDQWLELHNLKNNLTAGDVSVATIKKLIQILRPRPVISRPFVLTEQANKAPEKITDLMEIRYDVDHDAFHESLLSYWPQDTSWQQDQLLLKHLNQALEITLEDAVSIGIERDDGFGISDSNVPSVAEHKQNEYHYGFLPLVRATAEMWTRLSVKSPKAAFAFFKLWSKAKYKLQRRLALFAAASQNIPKADAASMLIRISQTELFLTNTTVEIFRLIKARWNDFTPMQREKIEARLRKGPPKLAFRKGANVQQIVDRCIYDILERLNSSGFPLTQASIRKIQEINKRQPKWGLKPEEQDGFHTWMGDVKDISDTTSDVSALKDVPDDQLIEKAFDLDKKSAFGLAHYWSNLCDTDSERALNALKTQADVNLWHIKAWTGFLRRRNEAYSQQTVEKAASLIQKFPTGLFKEISESVVDWIENNNASIPDDLIWPLWKKCFKSLSSMKETEKAISFETALNHPAGKLVHVLLKRTIKGSRLLKGHFSMLQRCMKVKGRFGLLAKTRLAADISYLYGLNPTWVKKELLPLFHWSSPEAPHMWSARKYANYIGPPELLRLMKKDFMALFEQPQMGEDSLRTYAGWLPVILLSNKKHKVGYPLTEKEARAALRKAGRSVLSHVAHILAIELEKTPKPDRADTWMNTIGPILKGIWPLDTEMHSADMSFKFLQLARSTEEAFPDAVDTIIQYMKPNTKMDSLPLYSIKTLDNEYYKAFPEKILEITSAIIGPTENKKIFDLSEILEKIKSSNPALVNRSEFKKLRQAA